jgi:hypothetical protein
VLMMKSLYLECPLQLLCFVAATTKFVHDGIALPLV